MDRNVADWLDAQARQRGLAPVTIARHGRMLAQILPLIGTDPSRYTGRIIRDGLLDHARTSRSVHYPKMVASALRLYLRHLAHRGLAAPDLDRAVPTAKSWRLATLLQGGRLVWQVRALSLIWTSLMPHKFTSGRRHKFPRKRCQVTNRAEYNESLRQRGNLTIWITGDAPGQWRTPRRSPPGGQPEYSEFAIATCLTLRTIYKLPLRQTQGLMRSIAQLTGICRAPVAADTSVGLPGGRRRGARSIIRLARPSGLA